MMQLLIVGFAVISVQVYIEATDKANGKIFKGKVAVIQVSIRGGVSLGLALGVSFVVIVLILLIFINTLPTPELKEMRMEQVRSVIYADCRCQA